MAMDTPSRPMEGHVQRFMDSTGLTYSPTLTAQTLQGGRTRSCKASPLDLCEVKPAMSAFLHWMEDSCHALGGLGRYYAFDLNRYVWFNVMGECEKTVWITKAAVDRERYVKEMEAFLAPFIVTGTPS